MIFTQETELQYYFKKVNLLDFAFSITLVSLCYHFFSCIWFSIYYKLIYGWKLKGQYFMMFTKQENKKTTNTGKLPYPERKAWQKVDRKYVR